MALKREELEGEARGEGCLGRAADDEPIFILRAHDDSAPDLVEAWAASRERAVVLGRKPRTDLAQVAEARQLARNMRAFRRAELIGAK